VASLLTPSLFMNDSRDSSNKESRGRFEIHSDVRIGGQPPCLRLAQCEMNRRHES
jgi:hypothetical protein